MNTKKTNSPATLFCFHCSKRYKTDKTHATHIRKYHCVNLLTAAAAAYKCSQAHTNFHCRHISSTESNDAAPPTFRCDAAECSKAFRNPKRLSEHKRRTHNATQLICEFCGYRTRFRCNLLVHRRTHTGELPFCCDRCGKCFAALYQFAEHKHTHANKLRRRYRCDTCGVAFFRPKALHAHGALHLAQKKFVCGLCEKAYAQAAGLSQHMRWHRGIATTKTAF